MISFNVKTLNSAANLPLYASLIKFDVAIFTFKKLLKMTVLKQHLEKADMDKLGQNL